MYFEINSQSVIASTAWGINGAGPGYQYLILMLGLLVLLTHLSVFSAEHEALRSIKPDSPRQDIKKTPP